MTHHTIIHPDIWQMNDDKIENIFPFIPIQFNMSILGCIENGRVDILKEYADQNCRKYLLDSLPCQCKWQQVMSFVCGIFFAFAVKGGLSCERASMITTKYIDSANNIEDPQVFVQQMLDVCSDFTKEVQMTKRIRSGHNIVDEAILYIEEHIDFKIKVADVANACAYSLSGLQHLFSKYMQHTITDVIRIKKIEKACFLLCYTHLDGVKISEKLSYSSQSHFIRQFSKEIGMTPLQYRKENSKLHINQAEL